MRIAAGAIDAVLRDAVARAVVPGVVAAISDRDGVLYEGAFGRARSAPPVDMRVDSIVRIASMSKVVTSLAVLMLLEEHGISLDSPFADCLHSYRQPGVLVSFDDDSGIFETRAASSAVTLRQLLSHTSGYGYWFLDKQLLKLTTGAPELFNPPFLLADPGAKFAYSASTDVLGQLVPELSGLALEEFFADRIFAPLGMRDTGYTLPADTARLTSVHAHRGGGYVELAREEAGPEPRGGGGLFSTSRDYLSLLRLFMNGGQASSRRLLSEAGIAAMASNQLGERYAQRQVSAHPERTNDFIFMDGSQKFGLGFMIETRDGANGRSAGTLSWGGIVNTYFWLDPTAGVAAVLLMQTSPFADPVCVELLARFERAVYGLAV